jgi:hypothetical protein
VFKTVRKAIDAMDNDASPREVLHEHTEVGSAG